MGKVIVLLCFAFLAMTLVICQEETPCEQKPSCISDDDCCGSWCNPWKSVCTTAPAGLAGGPKARALAAASGGAPAAASGGAPALFWPPWMGGWWGQGGPGGWWGQGGPGGSWREQGGSGGPWWGQWRNQAASRAEWAPEEEPAK